MTRAESAEERTAGCTLQPSLLFSPASAFVFSGRSGERGGQIPFSLKAFCLVNTTFPFSVLMPLLEFSEASTNSPAYTNY